MRVEEQHLDVQVRQGDQVLTVESTFSPFRSAVSRRQKSDPLVLDLDGDGVGVSTVDEGVRFDLTGDGVAERMATTSGGDGFLVLDRDGDGRITSG